MGAFVFVLFGLVVAGLVYLQYRIRQVRIQAAATLAARIGFAFSRDDVNRVGQLPFSLFMVRESWRNIDTELQRRYELIPNLVNTVKGYAAHERGVLEEVTRLRIDAIDEQGPPDVQATREVALGHGVGRLMAVAEAYPDLKANENFLALQHELVNTEDRIQISRRIYNANVRAYDSLVQTFPSLIIARQFHFEVQPYFDVEPAVHDTGPPSVAL